MANEFKDLRVMATRALCKVSLLLAFALSTTAAWSAVETAETGPVSDWSDTPRAQVRLISAATAIGPGGEARLGLQFKMEEGWKVYWRSPGDAGYPPKLDWSGSVNLKDVDFQWPAPNRFTVLGLTTLGYEHEVVFPITATIERTDRGLLAIVDVDYLTCNDICVPLRAKLTLALPKDHGGPSDFAHEIDRFRARVPKAASSLGISIESAEFFTRDDNAGVLRFRGLSSLPFAKPDILVEGPGDLAFAPPHVALANDGRNATFDVPVHGLKFFKGDLAGETVRLTIVDRVRAAEVAVPVVRGTGAAPDISETKTMFDRGVETPDRAEGASLVPMLGLALLGGLILNAMPCVLPVLSIKLLSLVRHGGGDRSHVRINFLASAAGVTTSFIVIALGLLALRSAGAAVGWGIQFQQPVFLAFMVLVIAGFAMNLFGFFDIPAPSAFADLGGADPEKGPIGHFLTGMLATLLATPCSAPFLGTAVAFALSRGAFEILAIFLCLGLGLALPHLLVAAFPKLATMMPRPGPWMSILKKAMGLALAATTLWLVHVIANVVDGQDLVFIAGASCFFVLGLFLIKRGDIAGKLGRGIAVLSAITVLVLAGLSDGGKDVNAAADESAGSVIDWVPFDETAIPKHMAAGRVVFVDVTADWCITCRVNKTFVLETQAIAKYLNGRNVVAMRADWTRPDEAIARYLALFDRYGIPFNAIHGPAHPTGLPLPELLSEDSVLSGLRAAGLGALANR